ncbi:MAG TPA: phospholipase D-like domain-containing protein [Candidatus Dormibacteraeota bacterium]|nr:phospholipase D-like domain-containing protein [Candidatus Dormibacteraeota bacterium]
MTSGLELSFLQDGSQTAEQVAAELAAFLGGAQASLDIAIYDLNLAGAPADAVRDAIKVATARGVAIRLLYNVDSPSPIPVPPPSQPDSAFIDSLGVTARPISGIPSLMHHKYVIRDAASQAAAVWTGSTNWTNDSWTREENVILRLTSAELAQDYARNFSELWSSSKVEASGKYDLGAVSIPDSDAPIRTHLIFSPGRGRRMSHLIADRIAHARRRVRVCSPVITSGVILGTLGDLLHSHAPTVDFKGVYDRTQMAEVLNQWRVDPHAGWKGPAFQSISASLPFASKVTTPYTPTSVHDFMHAKITVVDNTVLTGSYNLSHAGESNAENLLELDSAPLADRFVSYIDAVFARYGAAPASVKIG